MAQQPTGLCQRERVETMVARVGQTLAIQPVAVPEELAAPKAKLRLVKTENWNWTGPQIRKLFAMHTSMRVPPIEQINFILYPAPGVDAPVFLFFCMVTGRKLIGHINVNLLCWDDRSRARWVEPLAEVVERYPSFEARDRYPEWMKKWRTDAGIYGMFTKDRVEDLSAIMFEYLDVYLKGLEAADLAPDSERAQQLLRSQDAFIEDIRTQDKAQGIMAKMIGKDVARRIFYEVTT